ncbi:MAG: arginine--tRNA ligase [Candidatus Omnitrophota bacterium]
MGKNIQSLLLTVIQQALEKLSLDKHVLAGGIILDIPSDNRFGELSTNIALKLGKPLKQSPYKIAGEIVSSIQECLKDSDLGRFIKEVKIEGSGFINFYLREDFFYEYLKTLFLTGKEFLKINYGQGQRVLIEFVSANPTGALSVAHARQAAVGDVLANILDFLGFKVHREYYLNDEGNQINILGRSVELRLKELSGEKVEFPEDHYQGDYIYDIAREVLDKKLSVGDGPARTAIKNLSEFAVDYILRVIEKELDDFGVKFDNWYSQKELDKSGKIEQAILELKTRGFIYEQDGAVWFKSSELGDDKDRVVIKSDGSYTYLAPDIAYHQEKYKRGFSWLINLWGPDHHGYINRLKASVKAFGHDADSLAVIIVQLATIFREGKPVQMSTRKGQYITLREVLDEVGRDAARFFFLMRRTSSHLDFDLDIAKRQTQENPVYYVQYAHARIRSILRNSSLEINVNGLDLTFIKEKEELALLKKLWQFSYCLDICMVTRDPYMLTVYLQELAESFHKFYDQHRVLTEDNRLTAARLALINAVCIVISTGLELLGISMPEKM